MNTPETNLNDYFSKKTGIESLKKNMAEKEEEVKELNRELSIHQQRVSEIEKNLQDADRKMANGLLSTDDFMALKKEFYDKQHWLKTLNDAIELQSQAVKLIYADINGDKRDLSQLRKFVANDLAEQYMDEFIALAGEPLKKLAMVMLSAQQHARFTGSGFYPVLGEKLCKKIFTNQEGEFTGTPDNFKAIQEVEQIINELQ